MATAQVARDIITLKGSADIVTEFFCYAVNSIIYQRGLYPEEQFGRVKKYGLTLLVAQDESVKKFITGVTAQLAAWLQNGQLQRVVLVILDQRTLEPLERWNFLIETDQEVIQKGISKRKSDADIMKEIQAIMRQITSCVTFLPCLNSTCIFDVLAYTDKDAAVPMTWTDSDAKIIENSQVVKLRSFDTKVHKIDASVAFKMDSDA
ncbi:hypothetical protein KP509_39G059300 [Ceratopteris richardii]|uniref:HORMA domain-containing protein n=1 Tax=Ceratopteris richardii TaxID=49495 RepID=A0A8T2Q0Z2_CERRI|nr:hypothetical protein KP509_39G059300 [Ceratopteris richardii]